MKYLLSYKRFPMILFSMIFFLILTNAIAQPREQRLNGKLLKKIIWKGTEKEYVDGELAVKIKPGKTEGHVRASLQSIHGNIKQSFDELGWGWIELPEGSSVIDAITLLQSNESIEVVELNTVTRTSITPPNDPYYNGTSPATYPAQWGLNNIGQTPPAGTVDADIDAPEAWEITSGNSDVIMAILDSGIPLGGSPPALTHPDLSNETRIILGPDYADAPPDGVKDLRGHGTHVAGIAGAETNNGIGIAGVAGGCRLLIIQVFTAFGIGNDQFFYNGVKYAVDYQIANQGKRVVINYSGGGTSGSNVYHSAIQYASDRNVPIVVSAGNEYGGAVNYPAAYAYTYKNVIAVSATTPLDGYSTFSNKGCEVTVSSPGGTGKYFDGIKDRYNGPQNLGQNILSTTPNYSFTLQNNTDIEQNYGYMAGTSMAAPFVTGCVALLLSKNLSLSAEDIRNILQNNSDDLGGEGRDNSFGYGRINLSRALQSFVNQVVGNWNMLSVPNQIADWTKVNVWPTASSNATRWNTSTGAYEIVNTLTHGEGYWIQFGENQNITYFGSPIFSTTLDLTSNNTTSWNLIGSISKPVPTSSIVEDPVGTAIQPYFSYSLSSGYIPVSTIEPGMGIWVKASQTGQIHFMPNPTDCFNLSPTNNSGSNSTSVTLTWTKSDFATSYRLQVAKDENTFRNPYLVVDDPTIPQPGPGLNTVSKQITLDMYHSYYWRVMAINQYGTTNWSCSWKFTLDDIDVPPPCGDQGIASLFNLDQIIVTDANNHKQSLFLHNQRRSLSLGYAHEDLPPEPPDGFFGARFVSGKIIERIHPGNGINKIPIKIKDANFPVTFSWNIKSNNALNVWLTTGNNKIKLLGYGSYAIQQHEKNNIFVEASASDPCNPAKTVAQHIGTDEAGNQNPVEFALQQNTPNPFNPVTMINYQVQEDAKVNLVVYNTIGQEVATLVDEVQSAGYKTARFDAGILPSGVYFYRLQAVPLSGSGEIFTDIKKMLLAK